MRQVSEYCLAAASEITALNGLRLVPNRISKVSRKVCPAGEADASSLLLGLRTVELGK